MYKNNYIIVVKLDPVTMDDLEKALECTKPTTQLFKDKYTKWTNNFASNTKSVFAVDDDSD